MADTAAFSSLQSLITLLIALSVASQRLVDIIKGFSFYLRTEQTEEKAEADRVICLQLLAIGAGLVTALLAYWVDVLPKNVSDLPKVLLLGLLASGGSGFWTSILGYVNGLKDIKQKEAINTDIKVKANLVKAAEGVHEKGVQVADIGGSTESGYLTTARKNLAEAIASANKRLKLNS